MNKIKIFNEDKTNFFEIPWEWVQQDDSGNLNDLEASAERGKTSGYLYRTRAAEIPEFTIKIIKKLKQSDIKLLLSIIRNTKVWVYYFEKWEDMYVTKEFYVPKPNIPVYKRPTNNDTNEIIYQPFEIVFKGYGDIK